MSARIYLDEDSLTVVNPAGLNFQSDGTDPDSQWLTIFNEQEDNADVPFTATNVEAWLTLGAASGSFNHITPYELEVEIDVTGLVDGEYTDTITVTTDFGTTEIPVVLVVSGA